SFWHICVSSTKKKASLSHTQKVMNALISQITNMTTLAIPKSEHDRRRVASAFGGVSGESKESWMVPCSHALNTPADDQQIAEVERELGYPIPDGYKRFLRITNGAKLFIV